MRYWSLLIVLAVFFGVGVLAYAPFSPDRWLPNPAVAPSRDVSRAGRQVDALFLAVLGLTGLAFAATQAAAVRARRRPADRRDGHDPREEFAWTLVPGGILLFLAVYQMNAWADAADRAEAPDAPPLAEVTAIQSRWIVKYPGPDGALGTRDDLSVVNDLHFVKGEPTRIELKSADVVHSFFLPQLRIKRDAVPGTTVAVRLGGDRAGRYDLACAELCGWGHYDMRGDVVVHETRADFEAWLAAKLAEQARCRRDPPSGEDRRDQADPAPNTD